LAPLRQRQLLRQRPPITDVYCVRQGQSCIPGTVDETLVPGFANGTQFFRASAGLFLDLRDNPVRSAVGLIVDVGADYSHGFGADRSSYFRIHAGATVPFRLWSPAHVITLHVHTDLVAPLGSTPVPFTELAVLGGPNDLRGFRWQLFHGYSSFLATAEYRWPIWMWLDGVIFVDYGGVFGKRYDGFSATQLQPDVGAGVRIRTTRRFHLRFQFAYGWGEDWRLFVSTTDWP
jgi:outer membrane protein assembly factor BamA